MSSVEHLDAAISRTQGQPPWGAASDRLELLGKADAIIQVNDLSLVPGVPGIFCALCPAGCAVKARTISVPPLP